MFQHIRAEGVTLAALDKKILKSEEGSLVFLFYLDSAEGASGDLDTLNLRNLCKR